MQFLARKRNVVLIALACVTMLISSAHAEAAVSTAVAPTLSASTSSIGTVELRKEIAAERVRIAQLTTGATSTPGITRMLRRGSSGKEVRLLQDFLKLYSAFPTTTPSTGFFGPLTSHAVKEFQRKESIDSVGVVGPKTRARIRALSAHELLQEKTHVAIAGAAIAPQITDVIFSSDVGEDGSGVGSSTAFGSTTPNIYAIVTLSNARQDTAIGLIRYYNGIYVDSAVTHPSRSGLRYLHVQWSLKAAHHRVPGTYTTVWYVDGKKSKTATFTIN